MPPLKSAFRFNKTCCGVIVAANLPLSGKLDTKSAAFFVVMCSITTRKSFTSSNNGFKTSSMYRSSRSKMSTDWCVTSPCTCKTNPNSAIFLNAGITFFTSVTPKLEFVVAPAGYNLNPLTNPDFAASSTVLSLVSSVKYKVMCGSNFAFVVFAASKINFRYVSASSAVLIGGCKFGIMSARSNVFAVCGTTEAIFAPSRTCKCQSSGLVIVSVSIEFSFPVDENDKTTLPPPLRVGILLDDDDAVRRLRRPPPPLQRFPVELSKESKEETKETPPRRKEEEQEGVIVPFLVPTVVV
mmetsp:Transcript_36/g.134  ORF Transcript_36/g.134 Transcript_36/m.134 type:complete len:297 (-) Transcript_36:81-971(-)